MHDAVLTLNWRIFYDEFFKEWMNIMTKCKQGTLKKINKSLLVLSAALMWLCGAAGAQAGGYNEVQYQIGKLDNPFAGTETTTHIITFQHASQWAFGSNFFFIDMIDDENDDGFNDTDYYGEWYSNFSLSKIMGADLSYGALKDVGLLAGLNVAGDANIRKYLPGVRLSWDVPGFAFLNTDFTAYLDDSKISEQDSYMIDVNWAYPFEVANQKFSVVGHAEYIGGRDYDDASRGKKKGHILAQPQIRWDIGNALFHAPDKLYIGTEYQYWRNKLGTGDEENVAQGLVVWRL